MNKNNARGITCDAISKIQKILESLEDDILVEIQGFDESCGIEQMDSAVCYLHKASRCLRAAYRGTS